MDVENQYPKDLDDVCTNNVRPAKSSELRDGIVKCSEVQSWRQELELGKERSFSKLCDLFEPLSPVCLRANLPKVGEGTPSSLNPLFLGIVSLLGLLS